jgi:hypothetical protein
VVLVLMAGDTGVGGGGPGAEIGMMVEVDVVAPSSQESATVMEFVRTVGARVEGGEMVSLSREECSAEADVEVMIGLLMRGLCERLGDLID